MEAGQLEIQKGLEEVQVRNINAIIDYTRKSRDMVLAQDEKIKALNAQIQAQAALLNQFRIQLAGVQTKLFSGGTS